MGMIAHAFNPSTWEAERGARNTKYLYVSARVSDDRSHEILRILKF